MGFGFNLGMIFIILPTIAIFFVLFVATKKKLFGKAIAGIILGISALVLFSSVMRFFNSKTKLSREDFYGTYIVDRSYFKGRQADWQYEHYRFEIKDNDSIYFYCTDKKQILKTYKGTVSTVKTPYGSETLSINMQQPTHHIVMENPTIYRNTWDFFMVLHSEKFNNMFFTKGEWQSLNNLEK